MSEHANPQGGNPDYMPDGVEVRPAIEFTCDSCGRNSFQSIVSQRLSEKETKEYLIEVGDLQPSDDLPPNFALEITRAPQTVKCPHCGTEFPVENGE